MRRPRKMSRDEIEGLRGDMRTVFKLAEGLGFAPWVGSPHGEYMTAALKVASSRLLVDHLEAAGFFVSMFHEIFTGFGLRQEMENITHARELGWEWCYEPFDAYGDPVGVELEDGMELVFPGHTPLVAIVRMMRLMLPIRNEIWDPGPPPREEAISA